MRTGKYAKTRPLAQSKTATRGPPSFESQAAYLERHKLLSDDERESLLADAFEPVAYVPTPD